MSPFWNETLRAPATPDTSFASPVGRPYAAGPPRLSYLALVAPEPPYVAAEEEEMSPYWNETLRAPATPVTSFAAPVGRPYTAGPPRLSYLALVAPETP